MYWDQPISNYFNESSSTNNNRPKGSYVWYLGRSFWEDNVFASFWFGQKKGIEESWYSKEAQVHFLWSNFEYPKSLSNPVLRILVPHYMDVNILLYSVSLSKYIIKRKIFLWNLAFNRIYHHLVEPFHTLSCKSFTFLYFHGCLSKALSILLYFVSYQPSFNVLSLNTI